MSIRKHAMYREAKAKTRIMRMPESHVIGPARKRLPAHLMKTGSRLLHAQCWAWGQDVKRPAGNLLLEYGFDRLRPPAGVNGCSQYSLLISGNILVRLWGFGVYIGGKEGLYLNRFDFVPRQAVLTDQWTPAQLSRGRRHLDESLLFGLVRWLAKYEQWVEGHAGIAYRRSTFTSWPAGGEQNVDLVVDWLALEASLERYFATADADSAVRNPQDPTSSQLAFAHE